MEHLDGASLLTALLVLTGICGVLAALWKGAEALRHLTGAEKREAERADIQAAIRRLDARVCSCEERLLQAEARFDSTRSDLTQMLTVLNALLMHFISGNDHDKLRTVKEGLDNYMAGR